MTFNVHCAELCGVWHGYMFDTGQGGAQGRSSRRGSRSSRSSTRRRPSRCRRTRSSTSQTHRGEVDERDGSSGPARRRVATVCRLQPADRDRARHRRLADRLRASATHPRRESRLLLDDRRAERRRDHARLLLRCGRLPGRARLRELPRSGGCSGTRRRLAEHEASRSTAPAVLPPVHRPQGRLDAVHGRDRGVLLRRRAQRDADPDGAAPAEHARVRGQPVPDAGRHARLDDDGDDDLGDPRPVRQLGRAADDRLPAHGVPADRGVHVLAADGRPA